MRPPGDIGDLSHEREVARTPNVFRVVEQGNKGQIGLIILEVVKVDAPGHNVLCQPSGCAAGPGGQKEDKAGPMICLCLKIYCPALG